MIRFGLIKNYRGKDLHSNLIAEIEKPAKDKGCYLIHLDTFGFQAKEFYEKQGFEVFGVLEDCPKDHCRYYLKNMSINIDFYRLKNPHS